MRALSTAQQDLLLGSSGFGVYYKLEAETSSGGYTDLTSLGGEDWVVGAEVNEDVDSPVAEARALVRLSAGSSLSLSPLRTDSTINQTSTGGAAPVLEMGRELKISVATIAASCSPGSTDYELLFRGDIDSLDFGKDPLEIRARDPGGFLMDAWIEGSTYEYGSSGGTAIETVIQNILTDWATGVTVNSSSSPGFNVSPRFLQERKPVFEAIRDLGSLIGWELRYRWSTASTDFRLTFYDPQRGSTAAPASTFDTDRYLDVQQLSLDRTDVRNVVEVQFPVSSSTYGKITVQSTSAIDKYGRRWMGVILSADSPLASSSAANTFAQAVLDDLKDPKADQEVEMHLFWPAMLGDVYRWKANDLHYAVDQDYAVTGIRHVLQPDQHRTFLRTRGAPRGASLRYLAEWQRPAIVRAENREPVVQADLVRSGTTATLTLTIYDQELNITAVEFNKREGDGAATGWVSTWDTTSGTIGKDKTLTRAEGVTVSDGKDSEIRWRVLYKDAYGETRTIEDSLPAGNLRNTSKTIRFPHSHMTAKANIAGDAVKRSAEYSYSSGGAVTTLSGSAVFPPSVTLTELRVRTFQSSSASAISARLYRTTDAGGASALLATLTPSSSFQTTSAALSEAVSTAAGLYVLEVDLDGTVSDSTSVGSRIYWFDFGYDVTAYKDTY